MAEFGEPRNLARVVVGVDGSPASVSTLDWVARRIGVNGSLVAVHVLDDTRDVRSAQELLEGPWSEPARRWCREVTCSIGIGEAADVLVAEAERNEAECLAVGAHGAGTGRRRSPFLGGVARRLLARSAIPLIIHRGHNSLATGPVVACLGYGGATEAVATWAAEYARLGEHPLVLLHAVSHRPVYPIDSPVDMLGSYLGPGVDVEWAESDLAQRRDELLADSPDLDVSTKVVLGSTVRAILDIGAGAGPEPGAELVVVGKPTALPLPSPRLHQVIARAVCPIAVIPS